MTFQKQSEKWLIEIQTRRRDPVKSGTVSIYRSYLKKRILPEIGSLELDKIENGVAKQLVAGLVKSGLSASTVNGHFVVLKQIMASAVDLNGNEIYPIRWNHDFIDLPIINKLQQKAPSISNKTLQQAITASNGQDKALYMLLAGTGLRVGEALAISNSRDTGNYWDRKNGIIHVSSTMRSGKIQNSPKTQSGVREVDIFPELNEQLSKTSDNDGLVFKNTLNRPARFGTLREHLKKINIPGFHAFRRFRVTHLESESVPKSLIRFWIGHADRDITDRYIKIGADLNARKLWAEKAGLGFELQGV